VLRLAAPVSGLTPSAIDTVGGHATGTTGVIAGFGRSGGSAVDYGLKRYGAVSIASCLFGVSNTTSICWSFDSPLGPPGTDANTCNADSGGPLFIDAGAGPVVAGITSGGSSANCTPFDNSFDARVAFYAPFIEGAAGGDLDNRECGGIPQVGDPDVEVFAYSGSLDGAGEQRLHSFTVDSGSMLLRVTHNSTDDGVSNFRMYVRHGSPPTIFDYDCAATGASQYGSCAFHDPTAGTWYAMMTRAGGAGEYQLTATSFGTLCSDPGNDGEPCDDGNACTSGDLCQAGSCVGSEVADGAICDDGNACTQPDTCQSGVCDGQSTCGDGLIQAGCEQCDDGGASPGDGCDASCAIEPCYVCSQQPSLCGPPTGCAAAGRSILVIKDGDKPGGERLVWKWLRGTAATAAFGDPLDDDGYDLCVWSDGELVADARVAPGGACGTRPCWKAMGAMFAPSGYRFKNKSSNGDGIVQVVLKGGAGSAKILWKGRGANLTLPGAASSTAYFDGANLQVRALRDDGGACWASSFTPDDLQSNSAGMLKAVR
jgi:cysteine-rich repeat protein